MAYQSISAVNMERRCCVRISCTATAGSIGSISSVVLKRRYTNSTWTTILTKSVSSLSDLTFIYDDVCVRSGYSYDYIVIPRIGTIEQVGVMASCSCKFTGIYIGDDTGSWVALFNSEYTKQKNKQVAYITPLSGKYPRVVSNADTDYMTGSVTGLFLPVGDDCEPDVANAYVYKNAVLDMLNNKKPKLLKLYNGDAWVVSIDQGVKENSSRFEGASTISFNWTEIAALDTPPSSLVTNAGVQITINADGTATLAGA